MSLLAFHNPKRRKARRSTTVARPVRRAKARMTSPATKKKASAITMVVNPKRRKSARKMKMYRNPKSDFSTALKKSVPNKETLYLAGGALTANVVTNFVLNQSFAGSLPGMKNADGSVNQNARAVYATAIPLLASAAVRGKSAALADGMIVGSLLNAVQGFVAAKVTADPASKLALLQPPAASFRFNRMARVGKVAKTSSVRALPVAFAAYPNGMGLPQPPNTAPMNAPARPVYSSSSPFRQDAWNNNSVGN